MIEISGNTYRYNGEVLTKPEVIVINDHHYDEQAHCYHVEKLVANSICDPHQHLIIMDGCVRHDDGLSKYNCLCLPVYLAGECQEFLKQKIQPNWTNKTHAFNFMINKPRPHREFLLLMIEHFGLTDYRHTLPWRRINLSRSTLKTYTTNSHYHDIIDTLVNVPVTDYKFGPERIMDQGILNGNFKNAETYQHLLQKNIFEPTCVSLITEPCFFERESMFTEKTVMAMYAGTLPIWVGGWRLPEYMQSMGFDIFDDIIDHSYQDLADPLDRCYYAIARNLDLLKDADRLRNYIGANQPRLEHNLDLLQQNVFLTHCLQTIECYPPDLKPLLLNIVHQTRNAIFKDLSPDGVHRLLGTLPKGEVY